MELSGNRKSKSQTSEMLISQDNSQQVQALSTRHPILKLSCNDFLSKFPPDYPAKLSLVVQDIPSAHNGATPTVAATGQVYGIKTPVAIITAWLISLDRFVKEGTLSSEQIQETAILMARQGYFLKLAEVALFFQMLKSGEFGKLFGFTPMWIMENLKEFIARRRQELEKHEREQERIRQTEERKNWERNKASPEFVEKLRKRHSDEINGLVDNVIDAK